MPRCASSLPPYMTQGKTNLSQLGSRRRGSRLIQPCPRRRRHAYSPARTHAVQRQQLIQRTDKPVALFLLNRLSAFTPQRLSSLYQACSSTRAAIGLRRPSASTEHAADACLRRCARGKLLQEHRGPFPYDIRMAGLCNGHQDRLPFPFAVDNFLLSPKPMSIQRPLFHDFRDVRSRMTA